MPCVVVFVLIALVTNSSAGAVYIYGGDNTFYKEFDLYWYGFSCYTENNEGDVWLTDLSFQLFGPYIGATLPLQNVPGVAYDDGSVKIENVRKTDNDSLSVTKYTDHVHYQVSLTACFSLFGGEEAAHRYIRITVHGRKLDPFQARWGIFQWGAVRWGQ
jgi:hypothetical protein